VTEADRAAPLPDGFCRLGELLPTPRGASRGHPQARRVAEIWEAAVGPETARQAQPLSLRGGRLVVATSSSVWAQTLQLMAETLRMALNDALGEEAVTEVVCRPAGWDPGAGQGAARALSHPPAEEEGASARSGGASPEGEDRPLRLLTDAEECAVAFAQHQVGDPALGERIAAAMRASWARRAAPIAEDGPPEAGE
jgi:hypothetical protein